MFCGCAYMSGKSETYRANIQRAPPGGCGNPANLPGRLQAHDGVIPIHPPSHPWVGSPPQGWRRASSWPPGCQPRCPSCCPRRRPALDRTPRGRSVSAPRLARGRSSSPPRGSATDGRWPQTRWGASPPWRR